MKRKEEFRMPDDSITTNAVEYAKAWRALAEPFEKITGCTALGYDPGILFTTNPIRGGTPFTLPVGVLMKLNEKFNSEWWDAHQKEDAEREKQVTKKRLRKELAKTLCGKRVNDLSAEDKKILKAEGYL